MNTDPTAHEAILIEYCLGRIDATTTARHLGLDDRKEVETALVRARLPLPRVPLAIERSMHADFEAILAGQQPPGAQMTRVLSLQLTGNEEILTRYSQGYITAAEAMNQLHQDRLDGLERMLQLAGMPRPPSDD